MIQKPLNNWYAIQVIAGQEKSICSKILMRVPVKAYEDCFVPMVEFVYRKEGKYVNVVKPMFPGYLLVVSDSIREFHNEIKKITDFKRIIKTGADFTAIQPEEVRMLMGFCDDNKKIVLSEGIIEGVQIHIIKGPLKGYEGLIRKIDRHKRLAYVEINFFGTISRVKMPLEIISKS